MSCNVLPRHGHVNDVWLCSVVHDDLTWQFELLEAFPVADKSCGRSNRLITEPESPRCIM